MSGMGKPGDEQTWVYDQNTDTWYAGASGGATSSGGSGSIFMGGFVQANYSFVTQTNEWDVPFGNTFVGAPGVTASLTTLGSPVFISINANYVAMSGSPQATAIFSLARNGTNLGHPVWGTMVCGPQVVSFNNNASFWFVDFPTAGTYSYSLIACNPTGSGKITALGVGPANILAFEMKGANVVTASTRQEQAVPGGPLTGLSATILPTRGPVLALASLNYSNDGAGNWAWTQTRRDATDLGSTFGIALTVGTTALECQNISSMILDTPSLGASHTYTMRATNGAGTGKIGKNGQQGTLILWELSDVNFKFFQTTTAFALGAAYTDVAATTPDLTIVSRGRPIFVFGCTNINTTTAAGRSAWTFLRNGTSVTTASKGMQLVDGENTNDWNKMAIMGWVDTNITGATQYKFAGLNVSGSQSTAQGPTTTTFLLYELDAGTDVVAGPWIDGGSKIRTTCSVALSDGEETFAEQKGLDLFFYVSGSIGLTGSGAKTSLFGGDLVTSGAHIFKGGMVYNNVNVTGSYFIGRDDYVIGVSQSNGSSSIIFTPTGSIAQGRAYKIVDVAGNAATGSITISGSAGALIIGSSTYPLSINYGSIEIIRLGSNWSIG